ncbi:MAG: hypothetical protein AB7W16_19710 [Candidatus Obscuribacterales bacterium]
MAPGKQEDDLSELDEILALEAETVSPGSLMKDERDSVFTSFSEGLEAVDKFAISGLEDSQTESEGHRGDSFESFSQGLASIDKFEITGKAQAAVSSLDEFLRSSRSPLADFKKDPGPSLAGLLERLKQCPWRSEISVEESLEPRGEYCFDRHRIYVRPGPVLPESILAFSHQLYHAAHRVLSKLYLDGPLSQQVFVDTYCWSETAALLFEHNVRKELALTDADPVRVRALKPDGTIISFEVERVLRKKGLQTLRDLTQRSLLRGPGQELLKDILLAGHQRYIQSFETDLERARYYIEAGRRNGLPVSKI